MRLKCSVERQGFEPWVGFDPYDDLANRSLRPLGHLSSYDFVSPMPVNIRSAKIDYYFEIPNNSTSKIKVLLGPTSAPACC